MKALMRCTVLALLASMPFYTQAASEVIQLNYRMAQDVLPVAESVLGREGRATAYGNQLIVNASPDKIAELRSVLGSLDTQPRRLLITVDTQGHQRNQERGYRVDGTIGGRHGEVVIGRGERNGRDQARIIHNNTQSRDGSLRTIQTLEGSAALVQVGQDVPLRSTHYGPYGQVQERTEYRSVNQGFYVTATVHGDNVQIEIDSQNDRRSTQQRGVINTQNTSSRLSGRLGEWISVSGTAQDLNSREDGFMQKRYSTGREDSQLQLKVEVLD